MIFFDNASTTKVLPEVSAELVKFNEELYFNPSSLYNEGVTLSNELKQAKLKLCEFLGGKNGDVIFTSGATESNNLAILGAITGNKNAEYIFSEGEHPSVYNVAQNLKQKGFKVYFVGLNSNGTVNTEKLYSLINQNTYFVSLIHVSNENGAINDIKKIVDNVKKINDKVLFHIDGTQAFCKVPVNVKELGVNFYTISAHKFHGPKGVGALWYNIPNLKPIVFGGGQQNALRSGTENVAGIMGLLKAAETGLNGLVDNNKKVTQIREYIKNFITTYFDKAVIHESEGNSPYILSGSFKGVRGEVLLHMLETKGILISTGSACSSKKQGNRILESMGKNKDEILGNIRISFSKFSSLNEAQEFCNELKEELNKFYNANCG